MHLPHDTPIAAYHASVKDGGLGVPSLLTDVLRLRSWRMGNLREDLPLIKLIKSYPASLKALEDSMEWPKVFDHELCNSIDVRRMWASRLHETADGQGLKHASLSPASSRWLTRSVSGVSGSEFVKATLTRLGLLKTRLRATRGRAAGDHKLRACPRCSYRTPESLGHILQTCHMSHGLRIERHNRIVRTLERCSERQGWIVVREPLIPKIPYVSSSTDDLSMLMATTSRQDLGSSPQQLRMSPNRSLALRQKSKVGTKSGTLLGSLKPDLILHKGTAAYVVDPTIIADFDPQRPTVDVLAERDQAKVSKYDCPQVRSYCERLVGAPLTSFGVIGVSINWRGIVSPGAADALVSKTGELKLNPYLITLLSIRTLVGGYNIWAARKRKATR